MMLVDIDRPDLSEAGIEGEKRLGFAAGNFGS